MGAMNDFLTMVHENFVPSSSGREQGSNSQQPNCQHHHQQQQARRRPRRLNCERAKLLNGGLVGVRCGEARSHGADGNHRPGDDADDELNEVNWDSIPAPPITPPAAFRPSPDSCYRRIVGPRRGKKTRGVDLTKGLLWYKHLNVYLRMLRGPRINGLRL